MPDHPEHRIRYRLGRRGLMLTLMGVTYILIGAGVLIRPDITGVDDAYELMIPKVVRGIAWIVTGLIAAVFAWRKMPPTRAPRDMRWIDGDRIGWMALYVMPFIRITSYGGSWICWVASEISERLGIEGGEWLSGGTATAWYTAILHAPLILIVLICSGWRENTTTEVNFERTPGGRD
jgi:hypothetical protein